MSLLPGKFAMVMTVSESMTLEMVMTLFPNEISFVVSIRISNWRAACGADWKNP